MATTVAVIEDNPEFMNRFATIIDSLPEFSLAGAASKGADGIAMIDRSRADIYLVDLGLPDMDGIEVIRHAVGVHANCEVMVITVFGDDTHVIASIEAGATGYLLKDSSPQEIAESICTLRDGGSAVSPMIARKILQRLQSENPPVGPDVRAADANDTVLTAREVQVLRELAKGLSFKEIGDSQHISAHTVARHVKKIYRKLTVHSRGEAVYEATKRGLIAF
jgi:DNA-binding NarL/FixJ family response regulator